MAAAGKPTRKLIRPENRLRLGSRPVPGLKFGWEPEAGCNPGPRSGGDSEAGQPRAGWCACTGAPKSGAEVGRGGARQPAAAGQHCYNNVAFLVDGSNIVITMLLYWLVEATLL